MRPEIEKVVQLIQRKDPKSLEEALALLQNTVFSFSMKVCGQRQDAEDTMQEVLLKSVSNLQKFDNPKALMVWLYKVAKTHCLMSRRKSKFAPKEALSLEQLMPDRRELETLSGNSRGTPETSLLRRESAKRLRRSHTEIAAGLPAHSCAARHGGAFGFRNCRNYRTAPGNDSRPPASSPPVCAKGTCPRHAASHPNRAPEKKIGAAVPSIQPRQRRCKQMFAELSNYLDDELDDSLCEELEKHMDGCEPCKAFLSSLEQAIQDLRRVPGEFPDPDVAAGLRRKLLIQYQNVLSGASKANLANSEFLTVTARRTKK